ncbi:MAG: DNA topoisomerase (ATP-hydrolyzing) subunit B [bacterium]|nr:DNA topoisomerase (ATP-hydrolyzing) subunit B [bacterium]MDZ4231199.1 DNA topoisomerase (ATP-hydrolyzing) subunit B [Patescibacteria group bacterium]
MPPKKTQKSDYTAKDIQVLEGLDPVRKRPGMYIGSTESRGLHHLLWEVFDNAIDEVMAGQANRIEVRLFKDGSALVRDDGRGIPVDIHKQTKKSALETVMTTLHAGGKFGGEAYKVSGGLHGVGVSVVNALSKYLKVEVSKDGDIYVQEYVRGVPKAKVKKVGKSNGQDGTKIVFLPDPEVFSVTEFDRKQVVDRFRQRAYLTKGVAVTLIDEREEQPLYYGFRFDGGLKSFVDYLNEGGSKVIHSNIFYAHKEQEGIDVEVALNYNDGIETAELSFANGINTIDGGMHLTGFRASLTKTINDYARGNNLLKKGQDNVTGDDVREGLTAVVAIKLREPQFEGQTKGRLGNAEARTAVESVTSTALKDFMELNPNDAKAMVAKASLAAQARLAAKAAKDTVLRKGILDGLTLPGKLADCLPSTPVEEAELFLVEGDSAGGSSKSARDRRTQAILPLRGKVLNAEKHRIDKILANKEMISLVMALGTAIADEFDIKKLRYGKVVINTDADVDGAHIRTLLLTLFFRYFPGIIENGHLHIAQPPLYRISKGKSFEYAFDEAAKDKIIAKMGGPTGTSIQRYKGLGEMNPDQLWETTMDPARRNMKVVTVGDAKEADRIFDILMGGEVAPRKHFIQVHADSVKNLDV